MNLNCSSLAELVQSLPLVRECDPVHSGALRLCTPFLYPNGEHIDVFMDSDKELFPDLLFSDYGQTALYLSHASVALGSTARKRELVEEILNGSGVKLKDQELVVRPETSSPSDLSNAILRLSQVCVRLSDLATHQRLRSSNPFRDEVEDFFEAHSLHYMTNVKLPPVYGARTLRMDFEVSNGNKSSYINVLGALNEAAAHAAANEVFIKWLDLRSSGQRFMQSFVTVYNSQSAAMRIEDMERLERLSTIVAYPQQSEALLGFLTDGGNSTGGSFW